MLRLLVRRSVLTAAVAFIALAAAGGGQVRTASAAGPWWVDPAGNDGNTCLAPGAATACATISGAAAKASSGDAINVAAGNYGTDTLNEDKVLTVNGARAGVEPTNGRPGPGESIVKLSVTAGDISLDGFLFDAGGFGTALQGRYTSLGAHNALSVKNSVLQNGFFGLELPSDTLLPTFSAVHNYFHNNGVDPSANQLWAISPDTTTKTVMNNKFDGNDNADVNLNWGTMVVSSNTVVNDATFLVATEATALTVQNNAGSFNGDGSAIFLGKGNHNVLISGNVLTGAFRGVRFSNAFGGLNGGATTGAVVTGNTINSPVDSSIRIGAGSYSGSIAIDHNVVTGPAVPGVIFESASGATAAGSHVVRNNLAAASVGLTWPDAGTLDGTCNWWGAGSGPTGGQYAGLIALSPWLISSTLSGPCPAPVSRYVSTVVASPGSVVADGTTTSTITVTLKDSAGNGVSGKSVTLDQHGRHSVISAPSGTSNAGGVVTFTVTDTTVEAVTYTATDASDATELAQTATVTFVVGPASAGTSTVSATPTSVAANGLTTSLIAVTLRDSFGHGIPSKTIALSQPLGKHSIIAPASAATNASGVATFSVKDTTAESVTYTATDTTDSVLITQTATVTFTVGPISSSASTVVASPTSVVANGVATSTITVTLKDQYGNPVSGVTVALSQPAQKHSIISAPSGPSNASGVVTFTVTDSTAESVSYTATDPQALPQQATVTFHH